MATIKNKIGNYLPKVVSVLVIPLIVLFKIFGLKIQLNKIHTPKLIRGIPGNSFDPSNIFLNEPYNPAFLHSIKFGSTFKSTEINRHIESDKLIMNHLNLHSIILDIGASDGSTSLDLIVKLNYNFKKYFVTDFNPFLKYFYKNGNYYYYDMEGTCIVLVNNYFILYPQKKTRFISLGINSHLKKINTAEISKLEEIELINPNLKKIISEKIFFLKYNMFEDWKNEKPDLIKIANVLNPSYFTSEQIHLVISKIKSTLKENGLLLVIENRNVEKGELFRLIKGKFVIIDKVNGGVEIANLII